VTGTLPPDRAELAFRLDGRTALVTGAAGHLGRAAAAALAGAGATVHLAGRDLARLEGLARELDGLDARPLRCDVTDPASVAAAAEAVGGPLHVLVSNAHVGRAGGLAQSSADDFADAARLASGAAALLLRCCTEQLAAAAAADGTASVITVASMYGKVSPDPRVYDRPEDVNPPYYGAAKAGLLQLTRYAAVALAPRGIRVNAISPGPFPAAAPAPFAERLAQRVPLGRVGRPEELRTAVLFLASPASSYVTGIDLPVDGGWTAW